jgi:3-phenylpropionate/trans-cinnamate dioxygenase ferredoxin subunit
MPSLPKNTWHKIAKDITEINFSSNGLAELKVNGRVICVGTYKNEIFACTQKCPHAGGELANGYIDTVGNIVCPLHNYKFNLKNGRNVSGEGYFLKTFSVEKREDGIYVCFSE